jgi:hypothetical protein
VLHRSVSIKSSIVVADDDLRVLQVRRQPEIVRQYVIAATQSQGFLYSFAKVIEATICR